MTTQIAEATEKKSREKHINDQMKQDFAAICRDHAKKDGSGKIDVSSGSIQVDLTLTEIRQKLIEKGHVITEKIEDDVKSYPAMQALVNSYRVLMHRTIMKGIETKLLDHNGIKFTNQVINVGGWNTFIVDNFKKGDGWTTGSLTEEERREALELYPERFSTTDAVKFKGGDRGRRAAIDEEMLEDMAI